MPIKNVRLVESIVLPGKSEHMEKAEEWADQPTCTASAQVHATLALVEAVDRLTAEVRKLKSEPRPSTTFTF